MVCVTFLEKTLKTYYRYLHIIIFKLLPVKSEIKNVLSIYTQDYIYRFIGQAIPEKETCETKTQEINTPWSI